MLHHRTRLPALFFIVLNFTVLSFTAGANQNHYLDASTEVAVKLIAALNSHNNQQLYQFAEQNIAAQTLKRLPATRYAKYLAEESFFHGKLTYHSTQFVELADGLIETDVLVQSKNTELWYRIELSVTENAPHQITRIRLRASAPPEQQLLALSESQAVAEFKAYIERLTERQLFSGTVLVAKGKEILLTKAAGLASKRFNKANNIDTRFNLASMNKMFTSVTILKLVEQGKLALSSSLASVLGIKGQAEHFNDIQIQHLLSHTSGIGSFSCEQGEQSIVSSFDECLATLSKTNVNFKPGTQYRYSNDGMFILGLVIEKLTGNSYYQEVKNKVFIPANMRSSECLDLQYPVANAAIGYAYDGKSNQWYNNLFVHDKKGGPAGGCYSNVRDLFNFAQAMQDYRLLTPELTQSAWKAKNEFGANYYGFGFAVREQAGEKIVGHNGAYIGVSTQMNIYLNSGYTLIVLANQSFVADPVVTKFNHLFHLN